MRKIKTGFTAKEAEELNPYNFKGYNPLRAAIFSPESWHKELARHKGHMAAKVAPNVAASRNTKSARLAAEENMAEIVRLCVAALEGGMAILNENPGGYHSGEVINQGQIFNVIVSLKTKCKVRFDGGGDYTKKVRLDEYRPPRVISEEEENEREDED